MVRGQAQGLPEWEADRAYFAIEAIKAGGRNRDEGARRNWPSRATLSRQWWGLPVESLGGKGGWRKDHIADQTFVQGFSTHKNAYDFVTLDPKTIETMYSTDLQKPAGANFWDWPNTGSSRSE